MTIKTDVLKLEHSAPVELFVLDLSALIPAGPVHRFCNYVNELRQPVVWQGVTYQPFPIQGSGWEKASRGPLPRPTVSISDVTGLVGVLVRTHQGMVGGKLTRKRTLAKYLDAVNFAAGNPSADPNSFFGDEKWVIDRRARDNGIVMQFELAAAIDVAGVRIPLRQVIQNVCAWEYRSPECSYTGGAVADINDVATTDINLDKCGKRLVSCRLRFTGTTELPYGGFPTAGLARV